MDSDTTSTKNQNMNSSSNNNNNNSNHKFLKKPIPNNKRRKNKRKQQQQQQQQHHNQKQRSKTYKEIKQEKRELESMRKSLSLKEKQASTFSSDHHVSFDSSSSSTSFDNTSKISSRKTLASRRSSSSTSSFSSSSSSNHTNNQHKIKQRLNDIKIIRNSRTTEEEKRSNDRINKAHQLLDDFTNNDNDIDDNMNEGRTNNDDDDKSTETTTSVNTGTGKGTGTSPSTIIPDRYWYNGNLQQGQGRYVTRWTQGMKVAEPLRKYDPIATEKLLFAQPTKWVVRNVQIGLPLATWVTGVIYDIVTNNEELNRRNRAKQLLRTISGLGPAIIKGGQALASRSDLMPSEYLEELQKLQDDVPRFDNNVAFRTVESELGVDDFDSIFELIQDDPVAAASIGQVYKARLRTNGDIVALKIQRPKCEEVIALDLYVLRWWSGVANVITDLLNRDINVQSIIDDFGELIYRELDYVAEAANAQRFSELYANQVKDVFVPKVYSELTTSKVLTMEWVEGFRLTDNDKLEKYGLDRKKLVDTLVQCSLRQILGNGFCKFWK